MVELGGLTPELGLFGNIGDVPNLRGCIPTCSKGFDGVLFSEGGDEVDAHGGEWWRVLCRFNHSSHIPMAH